MQNETIARKLKSLLEGKKIRKDQVDTLAKMVAAKLLEKKYKRDDEEAEDKDEKDLDESGAACGGGGEAVKLKVDRDGDEPGDLPGDGLEPLGEIEQGQVDCAEIKKQLSIVQGILQDTDPMDSNVPSLYQQMDDLKAQSQSCVQQEGKSKQTHYKRNGNDESATIDPKKGKDGDADEDKDDKEESKTEGKLPPGLEKFQKGKDGDDSGDDKDDDKDEKKDLDEKTKKDAADRSPSDTPQDRLKPLEERGYGRGNEEPGNMFDPYENEEDEYGGGYGGEEDELSQYKDLLAALESDGPIDGEEAPADIQAQMDAEFGGGEEDEEEDPFGDPLKEWWDIRNARRTEKFMSWAIPKKK